MPRTLLPPRGIFAATRVVFDGQLSPSVKETLLQLMALSWGSPTHHTPPLSYAQLEAITGKNARTLRGHLLALRTYQAALCLLPAGAGQFIVALAPWLFTDLAPQPRGSSLPQPVKEEEEEELTDSLEDSLPLPLIDHPRGGGNAARERRRGPARRAEPNRHAEAAVTRRAEPIRHAEGSVTRNLSRAMQKRLGEVGVFPALIAEVARRAAEWQYSERELTALLDWCRDDQPERPAALFIGRVRAGARAPAAYAAAPCAACGQRGSHAPDCRARYAVGF